MLVFVAVVETQKCNCRTQATPFELSAACASCTASWRLALAMELRPLEVETALAASHLEILACTQQDGTETRETRNAASAAVQRQPQAEAEAETELVTFCQSTPARLTPAKPSRVETSSPQVALSLPLERAPLFQLMEMKTWRPLALVLQMPRLPNAKFEPVVKLLSWRCPAHHFLTTRTRLLLHTPEGLLLGAPR